MRGFLAPGQPVQLKVFPNRGSTTHLDLGDSIEGLGTFDDPIVVHMYLDPATPSGETDLGSAQRLAAQSSPEETQSTITSVSCLGMVKRFITNKQRVSQ
jgi:hypothetical protein